MPALIATEITIERLTAKDRPLLEEMYRSYTPLGESLGLPPRDPERRSAWLDHLETGINLLAFVEGKVVGHLALMPSGQSAEMALFVHEDFRRQGVAKALVEAAAEEARARGLRHLWVLISSYNSPARNGLCKFGFKAAWEDLGEMQMVLAL